MKVIDLMLAVSLYPKQFIEIFDMNTGDIHKTEVGTKVLMNPDGTEMDNDEKSRIFGLKVHDFHVNDRQLFISIL